MHRDLAHTPDEQNSNFTMAHSHSNDEPLWTEKAKNIWIKSLDKGDIIISDCAGKHLKQCHPQLTYHYVTWPATLGLMLKQYALVSSVRTETKEAYQNTSTYV